MTTPKPPRTPFPDQENAGNEGGSPLNETYLPSALKLTTPFWKGTRREHPTVVEGISVPPSARTLKAVAATPFSTAGSVCFPDELPLALFGSDVSSPAAKPSRDDAVGRGWRSRISTLRMSPGSSPSTKIEAPEESPPAPPSPAWSDPDLSLLTEHPEPDDCSAMIDAMADSFRQEIEAERVVLERLSSGTADPPAAKESTHYPVSKVLQQELQVERENRETILIAFAEERRNLHAQLEEVQIHADLSVRLAQEEAQRRIQEERSLLQMTREELAVAQDHAIADASRQATSLLQESRNRQNAMRDTVHKLQSDHSEQVKVAIQRVRQEAQENTKANLSIQKAATTHMFQRELFAMETELLETLDELDTIQSANELDKKELETRMVRFQLAVAAARAVTDRSVNSLQEQLEEAHRQLEEGNKEDGESTIQQLERIRQLEAALEAAKTERETAQKEVVSEHQRRNAELEALADARAMELAEHDKTRQLLSHTQGELHRFETLSQSRADCLDGLQNQVIQLEKELQGSRESRESQAQALQVAIRHLEEQLDTQKTFNEQLCLEHISKMVDLFQELRCVHKEELATVRNHLDEEHRLSLHSRDTLSREASICQAVDFYRQIATGLGKSPPEATPPTVKTKTSTFVSIAAFEAGSTNVDQEVEDTVEGSHFVALDQGNLEASTEKQSTAYGVASGRDNPTAATLSLVAAAHFDPPNATDNPKEEGNKNSIGKVNSGKEDDLISDNSAETKFLPSPHSAFRKTTATNEAIFGVVDPPPLVATAASGPPAVATEVPPPNIKPEEEVTCEPNIKASAPLAHQNEKFENSAESTPPQKVARSRTIPASKVPSHKKIHSPSSKRIPTAPNSARSRVARESRIKPIATNKDTVREKPRVKPPVPRLSKLSKTPAASKLSRNRIPGASNATEVKQRSVLKKPSTSRIASASKPRFFEETSSSVRRVATISGLPPRKSSHTTEGKSIPPRRPRPSTIAERGCPSKDQGSTRKPPSSSGIPRSLQKPTISGQRTRISEQLPPGEKGSQEESTGTRAHTKNSIQSMTPTNNVGSIERCAPSRAPQETGLQTPQVRRIAETPRAPSSQLVEDKFRSLCQTWSTAKTPMSERKSEREELPPSLQLDLRLAPVSTNVETPKRGTASRVRALGPSAGEACGRALAKQCYSSPITTPGFLLGDISSPEELLVSPISEPVNKPVFVDTEKLDSAIVRIQSFVRFSLATKRYHVKQRYQESLRASAIIIQKSARRFLARLHVHRMMASVRRAQQGTAALCVQTAWRRHQYQALYVKQRQLVVRLQCFARRVESCGKLRRLCKMKNAAGCIQKNFRAFVERKSTFRRGQEIRGAQVIQKTWRGHNEKSRYQSMKHGFCLFQKTVKGIQLRDIMTGRAAVAIQICWRSFSARSKLHAARSILLRQQLQNSSAITIQKTWRRLSCYTDFCGKKEAALRLQSLVRLRTAKASLLELKRIQGEKNLASTVISSFFFGLVARKKVQRRQYAVAYILTTGATALQSHWRRRQDRLRYRKLRKGIVLLQASVRSWQYSKKYNTVHHGLVLFQLAVRKRFTRRQVTTAMKAACSIQKTWRRAHAMYEFQHRKIKTITLQSLVRGHLLRKALRSQRSAATRVQTIWRMFRSANEFHTVKLGFTKLQSLFRAIRGTKTFQTKLSAIVYLQASFRTHLHRRKYHCIRKSLVSLQCHIRGRISRHQMAAMQTAISVRRDAQRQAIVRIQRVWRMRKAAFSFKTAKLGFTQLQSRARRLISARNSKAVLSAVLVIQRRWRVFVTRKAKSTAAVTLQRVWRRIKCMKYFKDHVLAAVTLQSVFRSRLEQGRFSSTRMYVIRVQSAWRSHRATNGYALYKTAIVTLQSLQRSRVARAAFYEVQRSVQTLQRVFKGRLCRMEYLRKRRGVILMQSWWRMATLRLQLRSVAKIQRASKRYLDAQTEKKQSLVSFKTPPPSPNPPLSARSTKRPALGTISTSKGRKPLGNIPTSKGRKPLGDISKGKVRKPLGEVTTMFSPVKTRIRKRGLTGPENSHNLVDASVGAKRQKSELKMAPEVAFPRPDQMKVVELREALQVLGVKPKDFRKLRKAQLIEMINELQQDGGEGVTTTIVA
jgi:hypothetical protein